MLIKKIGICLALFLFFIGSPSFALETTSNFRVVNDKNETVASKRVLFHEGETLYEVTKRVFDTEESEGHIVSINGIRSIPEKNIHWAVFVNGDLVHISLNEINLHANDDVVWALRNWDNEEILK